MSETVRHEVTIPAGESRTNPVNLNRSTPRRIHTDPATEGGRLDPMSLSWIGVARL